MITVSDLNKIEHFFSDKFQVRGAVPEGVDYNSLKAQEIRFAQIAKLFSSRERFSLIDYGCGYGALACFLDRMGYDFSYVGYDPSMPMIQYGRDHCPTDRPWHYTCRLDEIEISDFTVACGIFNVKLDIEVKKWEMFIETTLEKISSLSCKGFAFNMLTKYSDRHRMRDNLFYGDPAYYFDFCKRKYARNVALLHDYDLYDFTILVRK